MKLKLLTPDELEKQQKGTILYSINGEKVVVGKDYIDGDTRRGFLAYGKKVPDSSKEFNWDTSK